MYLMWNAGWLWSQWMGNVLHLELMWGTPIYFAFLRWHQYSSRLGTVFLAIVWCSFKEIEVPYVFDWVPVIALHAMHANLASSFGKGEVSWDFSSCGRHLWYNLESLCGWPFETRVYSAKSGFLSSFYGRLRNLYEACQDNTDASGGEARGQASLICWHSYIGIPINFHEQSGILTFWSTELHMPLDVSKGCQAPCSETAET